MLQDKAPQALRRPGAAPAALSYGCYPVPVRAPASDNAPQPLPAPSPGRPIPLLESAGLSAHFWLFWTGSEGGLWPGPLGCLPCRSRAVGRAVGSRGKICAFCALNTGAGSGKGRYLEPSRPAGAPRWLESMLVRGEKDPHRLPPVQFWPVTLTGAAPGLDLGKFALFATAPGIQKLQ